MMQLLARVHENEYSTTLCKILMLKVHTINIVNSLVTATGTHKHTHTQCHVQCHVNYVRTYTTKLSNYITH